MMRPKRTYGNVESFDQLYFTSIVFIQKCARPYPDTGRHLCKEPAMYNGAAFYLLFDQCFYGCIYFHLGFRYYSAHNFILKLPVLFFSWPSGNPMAQQAVLFSTVQCLLRGLLLRLLPFPHPRNIFYNATQNHFESSAD
jgi:hypothetical protein